MFKTLSKIGFEIHIQELLKYGFTAPTNLLYGIEGDEPSNDGWADHLFPRKINFAFDSMDPILKVVSDGHAVAYLPDFLAKKHSFFRLRVVACGFKCKRNIYLVCRDKAEFGWTNHLF